MRPERHVQRVLVSATTDIIGEFETDWMRVDHAWHLGGGREATRSLPGPYARKALVISFRTDPAQDDNLIIHTYEGAGPAFSAYFSVLFGKRFDSHGPIQASGLFNVPDLSAYGEASDVLLPQNKPSPRSDYPVPLRLEQLHRLLPLWTGSPETKAHRDIFHSASKFYWQALQAVQSDPEVAYLHLISAGEVLSGGFGLDETEALDETARAILDRVAAQGTQGQKDARVLRSRLLGIRRRFVTVLNRLLDQNFFERREAQDEWGALERSSICETLGAAYDLRSRYVHVGQSFGSWAMLLAHTQAERTPGEPQVSDPEFKKILMRAPTYIGLERCIRYGLLRFADQVGLLSPDPTEA